MVFDRGKEKNDQDSLYLNKILIERVKFTKFLGVIIDEKLTWTHHISYIKNKISKGFGIILRALNIIKEWYRNLYVNYLPLTAQFIVTIPVINKDKIRSAYGKHKFMYRNFRFVSVHVWNYLASNIIINTSLADFKNKSKIFIMSNKFNLAFP